MARRVEEEGHKWS